jgi:branched-chain amino acid transport system ATP-binding protein
LGNPLLEVKGIDVSYGDIQVLWDVSLTVEEGAIVALSGLIKASKGEVLLGSRPLTNASPKQIVEKGIVQVPEGRRLFSSLTVIENLKLGAYIAKARANYAQSLERVFSLFPVLKNRQEQKAGSLSGGEQQMLAIGRAIMTQPQILMLDEPSLGLSPIMVRTIFQMIGTLNEQKTTILMVEQNVNQALKIAHQAYILKTGKIVMSGKGEELLANEKIGEAYLGKHLSKR